jgi:hypothetical protein
VSRIAFVTLATVIAVAALAMVSCGSSGSSTPPGGRALEGAGEGGGQSGGPGGGPSGIEDGGEGGVETGDATSDGSALDAGLPPIDGGAFLNSLTPAQLGELCDWSIRLLAGGYDAAPYYCGGPETLDYPANQTECVAGISYNFACQEKVADYENCTLSEVPTHGCNTSAPACRFECFVGDAGFGP